MSVLHSHWTTVYNPAFQPDQPATKFSVVHHAPSCYFGGSYWDEDKIHANTSVAGKHRPPPLEAIAIRNRGIVPN
ncbi:hypothetical protein MAA_10995 [Metarhizium robertsii ARSEF 23]|uniref:Uncharacterized protein n=1 Tax=Metarhizium robertsii (strain ARSEF 23 / ATCC MYA-3075) TaxID=655844 RepID=A0A0B2XHM8_METRA|nr:uncharacterized protein MAA_10995 [Metarhizium robertsii ARSEF 23]KHO11479.1 hypothetical protein MAA_10995 [Metarhizium robertsii ARSEF 23]